MILALSGLYAAGKGEVVEYLVARSFYALSLSDVIREELADRGLEETRERMIEVGREIRASEGPGGLAERLARKPTSPLGALLARRAEDMAGNGTLQ